MYTDCMFFNIQLIISIIIFFAKCNCNNKIFYLISVYIDIYDTIINDLMILILNQDRIHLVEEYIDITESQIYLYKIVPLYYQSEEKEYILYKKPGDKIKTERINEEKHPKLFIKLSDRSKAREELFDNLNTTLAELALSRNLKGVRSTLTLILEEAFRNTDEASINALPQTINVLFERYNEQPELLETIERIKSISHVVIDHTINVMILTFRYCFFHKLSEQDTKKLALCALVHDIGTSEVDKNILNSKQRLTDEDYETYTNHTSKGCDLLSKFKKLDSLAATVAQEHHERIDGSGYPLGRINICFESELIGLIDCYEPLTYLDKTHRNALSPFDSFKLLKEEVLQGKFSKQLFKDYCSCMGEKVILDSF